jgi:hypothetical protein
MELIIIAILLGLLPAFIAQSKGRSFIAWWIYGAAIFIIALPHSILIKKDVEEKFPIDLSIESIKEKYGNDAVTLPSKSDIDWTCVCGTKNPLTNEIIQNCSYCHRNRDYLLRRGT